jgi:gliding motility-associated-like protein
MKKGYSPVRYILLALVSLVSVQASAQLRINEVSQGASGTKEYVELVVVGTRTCTDSCADIREWLIDDNSGWLGAGSGQGIATGCMRFANDPNWSCVPYGSIILVYNDGDMNGSITQAPDPTDANNDNVYIVPASSAYMERHASLPISPSSLAFVYPNTGYISGGSWSTMGLANTGDGVIITSPANLGAAYHSLGYGGIGNSGGASIYIGTSGGGTVYYLTDNQFNQVASWSTGSVPGNETPGAGNTPANTAWINGMLSQTGGSVSSDIYACINQGGSYNFNNQNLTTTGIYQDTFVTTSGCDSIVNLHLQAFQPNVQHQYFYGCGSYTYQSVTYTASTDIADTTFSVLGCDSIVDVTHIVIQNITPAVLNSSLSGCGSVDFNGNTYTSSTTVVDTIESFAGCDSVYANMNITVYPENPIDVDNALSGCGKVVFNGVEYTSNTTVEDTLFSIYGCDSVHIHTNITIVAPPGLLTVTPGDTTICPGAAVQLIATGGSNIYWVDVSQNDTVTVSPPSTKTYVAVGTATNGCNDTAKVTITVEKFELVLSASEVSVIEGETFYLITSGNYPYMVDAWLPVELFPEQNRVNQTRVGDITRTYIAYGHSLAAGCKDTSYVTVIVEKIQTTYMPNVFSPNGDGLNDYIFPLSNMEFKMQVFRIYNRWGEMVYEWKDGDTRGWNGTYKGAPAEMGVYAYYFKLAHRNGEILEKKGNITLIR